MTINFERVTFSTWATLFSTLFACVSFGIITNQQVKSLTASESKMEDRLDKLQRDVQETAVLVGGLDAKINILLQEKLSPISQSNGKSKTLPSSARIVCCEVKSEKGRGLSMVAERK